MTQTLTIQQANAYCRARYSVETDHQTIPFSALGQSDALKTLLASYKVDSAALISAYNPYSNVTEDSVNRGNQQRLIAYVSERWQTLPGQGVDPDGKWVAEPSLLILGIELEEALALGREYDQHALIFVDAAGYTSLMACDPANQSTLTPLTGMREQLEQELERSEATDSLYVAFLPKKPKKTLLYRVVPHNNGIVFAPPDIAIDIARIHTAIKESKTWGDFKRLIPEAEYEDLTERIFYENKRPKPMPDAPFSAECIPGWSEGDYPPWLQQEMDRYVPNEILEQYGERKQGLSGKEFWIIPAESLKGICAALAALGWNLERAQNLPFR